MITEASVRRAINHLGAFGDTDLFPRLPEMRCFLERPEMIAKDCEKLNIGQYTPISPVETLTPKSWLGFRIAHQLTASDNVIYLAALLDCAPMLEAARLLKEDKEAFATASPRERQFGSSSRRADTISGSRTCRILAGRKTRLLKIARR